MKTQLGIQNAFAFKLRGTPHYYLNVCLHCGDADDPEGYWGEDEDGDRICYRCEQGLDGRYALVPYDPLFTRPVIEWPLINEVRWLQERVSL